MNDDTGGNDQRHRLHGCEHIQPHSRGDERVGETGETDGEGGQKSAGQYHEQFRRH